MRSIILQPDEEVVTVFRQSPAILTFPALVATVLLFVPFWYATKYSLVGSLKFWLFIWALLVFGWFLEKLVLWHREKYIVTTTRFVKTSHQNVFKQEVSETALDRILNVSFRTTGPWSMITGFGDIDLQVVGRVDPIIVKSVQRPAVVKEFLWRLHEQSLADRPTAHNMQEYGMPNQRVP